MAIQLVVDSAADIIPDEAARLGLIHVPLTVRFEDGSEYRDRYCRREGGNEMIGKACGSKSVNNLLRQLVENSGGIDFSRPVCVAYSGEDDTLMKRYIEDSKDLYAEETDTLATATIGSVIGTHAGAGAVAVVFFAKD